MNNRTTGRRKPAAIIAAGATVALLMAGLAPAANADLDTNLDTEDAISLVEELTPVNEEIDLAPTKTVGGELVTKDGKVEVSPDASEGTDLALPGGLEITIAPVADAGHGEGELVDGQAVTPVGEDQAVVTQPTDDGVRMVSILETPEAGTAVDYALDLPADVTLVPSGDGGFSLVQERQDVENSVDGATVVASATIAEIEAPWAADANGNPVDTHFIYNESTDTLTQVITPNAETAYPIVADPYFIRNEFGWRGPSVAVYLDKPLSNSLIGTAAYTVAINMCGVLVRSANAYGIAVAFACAAQTAKIVAGATFNNAQGKCTAIAYDYVLAVHTFGHKQFRGC